MDNIRATIDTLFSYINGAEILKNRDKGVFSSGLGVTEEMFCQKFMIDNQCYTLDQVHELYRLLISEWIYPPMRTSSFSIKEQVSLFYVLQHFNHVVLTEKDGMPVCRYNHVLRWRNLAHSLGEDIFTTSFFAYKDIKEGYDRLDFCWPSVVKQDNPAINHLLEKGVTDLHFHLRGSSLNYALNWLCLMNNIRHRGKSFEFLHRCLSHKITTDDKEKWDTYYLATVKACIIRYYLFCVVEQRLERDLFEEGKKLWDLLGLDSELLIDSLGEFLDCILISKCCDGYQLRDVKGRYFCPDYAIQNVNGILFDRKEEDLPGIILSGERRLMYKMFYRIFTKRASKEEEILFYVYLLQKTQIRKELVQLNAMEGFRNFLDYERRKEIFIEGYPNYQNLIPRLALDMAFLSGCLKYLECRITPKNTSKKLIRSILQIEKLYNSCFLPKSNNEMLGKERDGHDIRRHYYVLHFIKKADARDRSLGKHEFIQCRHFDLRNEVRKQGRAILDVLEKNKAVGKLIAGIDAANSELYCRPEVFGLVFRYIKTYNAGNYLNYTYHVGEDFWDIADGLRAIDEAILFLNLEGYDRLGHALALGVDVDAYYLRRNHRVVMSKQNLLDNAMWLHCRARELGVLFSSNTELELQRIFTKFYDEIYLDVQNYRGKDFDHYLVEGRDIDTYYRSWLLRGDDPNQYIESLNLGNYAEIPGWGTIALNEKNESMGLARKNRLAKELYKAYHFDVGVRMRGNERYELVLSKDLVELIGQVQEAMRIYVASLHLSVEANITSNRMIGPMYKYVQHPIVKLYDLGLGGRESEFCPQISVSINTDDKGIFDTSIELEYALLALALEKELTLDCQKKYASRRIYEWLDRIRLLGYEQRFIKN